MPPFIIPIFIPHLGCPHQCLFCNQIHITGQRAALSKDVLDPARVSEEIELWLSYPRKDRKGVEVAFYGGSFTGLPGSVQSDLLDVVAPLIKSGRVDGVRLSTRPDYIDAHTGAWLQERGVRVVELGVQSMQPEVLLRCRRGHTVGDTERAFDLLRKSSLSIGAQLMIGLPGETIHGMVSGAARVAELRPDFVRLYPAVVVTGSQLAEMYTKKTYRPLSNNEAVARAARLLRLFTEEKIPVIRIGLQPGEALADTVLAGPYHPALGECVRSRHIFLMIRRLFSEAVKTSVPIELVFSESDRSLIQGQRRSSFNRLKRLGLLEGNALSFQAGRQRGIVEVCTDEGSRELRFAAPYIDP